MLTNKTNEQNEYFTKEIETIQKNHTHFLELESSINKMKNQLVSLGNRTDQMEERTSDIEDINL